MDAFVNEYQKRIKAIYEKHSPTRFNSVEKLLAKYKGREREFYEKVCLKYGIPVLPPPLIDHRNIQHVKVYCRFRPTNEMEKEKELEFLFKKTFNMNQKEYDEFRYVLDNTIKSGIIEFPLSKTNKFNKKLLHCNTEDCCLWLDHKGLGQHKRFFRTKKITGAWLINPPPYSEKRALEITTKEVINFQRSNQNHRFELDGVVDEKGDQDKVFKMVGQDLVDSVLGGYNATVFAYGQTGTGKTHTMFSPEGGRASVSDSDRGLIPRTISEIIRRLKISETVKEQELELAVIEIYREELVDLLSPGVKLQLRYLGQDSSVDNLSWRKVCTTDEALELIQEANSRRQTAAHCANETSSRSHVIITLKLKATTENGNIQTSRLNFADLAGSERVVKTLAKGKHLLEAKNILKSLFALQNVIRALSAKKPFIPYQGGMLTKLLRDSLGGNSRTSIIVTASPHEYNRAETVATLQFGEQAKKIANQPKCNRVMSRVEMEAQLSAMEEELQYFKRLNSKKNGRSRSAGIPRQHQQELSTVVCQHSEQRLSLPITQQRCFPRPRGIDVSFCSFDSSTEHMSTIPKHRVLFRKQTRDKRIKDVAPRRRKGKRKYILEEKQVNAIEEEDHLENYPICEAVEEKCGWYCRARNHIDVDTVTTNINLPPSIPKSDIEQQSLLRDLKDKNLILQNMVNNLSRKLNRSSDVKRQDNDKMKCLQAEIDRLNGVVEEMKKLKPLEVSRTNSSPTSIRPVNKTVPNRRYFLM